MNTSEKRRTAVFIDGAHFSRSMRQGYTTSGPSMLEALALPRAPANDNAFDPWEEHPPRKGKR